MKQVLSVKWAGAFFCLISLVLIGAGCSKQKSDKDALNVAIQSNPITLDPRLAADAFGDKIAALIFDGLFQKDDRLNVVPNLAERYEQPDEKTYRIFLRKGVHFQDGKELTADDVVYTITSILDPKMASPYKGAFDRVKEVVAEDPYTVRFELSEPYAPFLTSLCRGIVPKQVAEERGTSFGSNPLGTGPYRFVRWQGESLVELAANDDFFGERPKVPHLLFQIVKDDNVRVLKLIKGDIDLVLNGIPALLLKKIESGPDLSVKTDTGIIMAYVGTNLRDPILKDVRVRRAIAYGIDRDEIIRHRWQGLAVKANSILAPSNWAYDRSLSQISYDPEAAKHLLDAAGYPDPDGDGPKVRFTLTFKTSTLKERVDIVRMIAHQLAKIGVGINVQSYEWGTFFRDVRSGNFQLYSLTWVGVTDPDIFYDVFQSKQIPPSGLNRGYYSNPVVDRLVEDGRTEMDEGKRKEIYAKVQEILLGDLPVIPLWYEKNVAAYRTNLKDVTLRADASFRPFVKIEKQGSRIKDQGSRKNP